MFVSHLRYCIDLKFFSFFYHVPFKQFIPLLQYYKRFVYNLITSTQLSRQYGDALRASIDFTLIGRTCLTLLLDWLTFHIRVFGQKWLFLLSEYFYLFFFIVSVFSRGYSDTYSKNSGAGKDLQGNKFECTCKYQEPT